MTITKLQHRGVTCFVTAMGTDDTVSIEVIWFPGGMLPSFILGGTLERGDFPSVVEIDFPQELSPVHGGLGRIYDEPYEPEWTAAIERGAAFRLSQMAVAGRLHVTNFAAGIESSYQVVGIAADILTSILVTRALEQKLDFADAVDRALSAWTQQA